MLDGRQIEETLRAPPGALEKLLRAPDEALRQGVQRLNQAAQRSGLPRVPKPPSYPGCSGDKGWPPPKLGPRNWTSSRWLGYIRVLGKGG